MSSPFSTNLSQTRPVPTEIPGLPHDLEASNTVPRGGRAVLQVIDAPYDGTKPQVVRVFTSNDSITEGMRNLPDHQSGTARILEVTVHSDLVITGLRDAKGPETTRPVREDLINFLQDTLTQHFDERRIPRWLNVPVHVNDIGSISSQWSQELGGSNTHLYRLINRTSLQQDPLDYDLHPRDSYLTCAQYANDRLIVIIVNEVSSKQTLRTSKSRSGDISFQNPRIISKILDGKSCTSISNGSLETFVKLLVLDFFSASIYLQPVNQYAPILYPQLSEKIFLKYSHTKNPHLQVPLGLFEPRLSAMSGEVFKEIEDAEGILRAVNNLVDSIEFVMEALKSNNNAGTEQHVLDDRERRMQELKPLCLERSRNAKRAIDAINRKLDYLTKGHSIRDAKSIKILTILAALYLPLSLSASILSIQTPFRVVAHTKSQSDQTLGQYLVGTNLLVDFFGVFIVLGTATILILYCIRFGLRLKLHRLGILLSNISDPFSIFYYGWRWRFPGKEGRMFDTIRFCTATWISAAACLLLLIISMSVMLTTAQNAWDTFKPLFTIYCVISGAALGVCAGKDFACGDIVPVYLSLSEIIGSLQHTNLGGVDDHGSGFPYIQQPGKSVDKFRASGATKTTIAATNPIELEGEAMCAAPSLPLHQAFTPPPTPPKQPPTTSHITPTKPIPKPKDSGRKSRHRRKKKVNMVSEAVPKSAYIPPHLRKKSIHKQQNGDPLTPARATDQNDYAKGLSSTSTKPRSATTAPRTSSASSPSSSALVITAPASRAKFPQAKPALKKPIVWGDWNEPSPDPGVQPSYIPHKRTKWVKVPAARRLPWPRYRDMRPQPSDDVSVGGCDLESKSAGDPEYDVRKLVDWEGNWMPGPVEWDGRKAFHNRHFGDHIEKWINGMPLFNGNSPIEPLIADFEAFNLAHEGDLAPMYWVPVKIEGDSPQQFWRTFANREPAPLDDEDILCSRPWWNSYADEKKHLLHALEAVEASLDPDDEGNRSPGVALTVEEVCRRKAFATAERHRRTLAKRNRQSVYELVPPAPAIANTLKPTVNIYLRPVRAADVVQVNNIYNYYVQDTILANEFIPRSRAQMASRIHNITSRGLPWLVAVARSGRDRPRQAQYVSEKIVGFINIDDYCDPGSMYRFTMEMEMYVDPEYLRKGVGSCLLDQMLSMVDTGHVSRGGYDYVNQGEYLKFGCSRVVKIVSISYPHENGGDISWFANFLKSFKFRCAGHLKKIGYKAGKAVDVSTYTHETTEHIEANLRPSNPL